MAQRQCLVQCGTSKDIIRTASKHGMDQQEMSNELQKQGLLPISHDIAARMMRNNNSNLLSLR